MYLEDRIFEYEITQKDSASNSSVDRSDDRSARSPDRSDSIPGLRLDSRFRFWVSDFSGYSVLLLSVG